MVGYVTKKTRKNCFIHSKNLLSNCIFPNVFYLICLRVFPNWKPPESVLIYALSHRKTLLFSGITVCTFVWAFFLISNFWKRIQFQHQEFCLFFFHVVIKCPLYTCFSAFMPKHNLLICDQYLKDGFNKYSIHFTFIIASL